MLRVEADQRRIARHGINASDVLDVVAAVGGKPLGHVVDGQRRFAVQARIAPEYRDDVASIKQLTVADPTGRLIPIGELANVASDDGVYEIWRKGHQRRAMIQVNIRGRDLAGFVAEAQERTAGNVTMPQGYYLEWGGTFQNFESARKRLAVVVPIALGLIGLLLYASFGSAKLAAMMFMAVPLAAIGGVLALWLRGLNFSISAGVGFIALSGVAVMNGLVMVSAMQNEVAEGDEVEGVTRVAMGRMRPVLMTALVASLGFLPMAVAHGSGAEVQRPLATVVIGGLITSTLLTLLVVPATYRWFRPRTRSSSAPRESLVAAAAE